MSAKQFYIWLYIVCIAGMVTYIVDTWARIIATPIPH